MIIWLINPYDELPCEGPEQRYGSLARMLIAQGHKVVWVSSGFRHREKRNSSEFPDSSGFTTSTFTSGDNEDSHSGFAGKDRNSGSDNLTDETRPVNGTCVKPDESGTPNEVQIILIDAPQYKKNISAKRLGSQWAWGQRVEKEMRRRVASGALEKPDVILASSPPLEGARAGLRLAKHFGAKGIVDFMDDWPTTWVMVLRTRRWKLGDGRWGILLGRMVLWPWFRLAKNNMRVADAVSAQSFAFAERARELGHQGEVHVCYLGGARSAVECGSLLPPSGAKKLASRGNKSSSHQEALITTKTENAPSSKLDVPKAQASLRTPQQFFRIIYLGAMGRIYDIETVLQAATLAKEAGFEWQWTLVGTDPDGKWAARVNELGLLQNVKFPGYLQGCDFEKHLATADVGLIPMDPQSGVAVPYKAGSYLAAGLPIISSLPGELAERIKESGAGLDYEFGNAESLFEAIKIYADDSELLASSSLAAQAMFEKSFNREKTYPAFVDWIEQIAKKKNVIL